DEVGEETVRLRDGVPVVEAEAETVNERGGPGDPSHLNRLRGKSLMKIKSMEDNPPERMHSLEMMIVKLLGRRIGFNSPLTKPTYLITLELYWKDPKSSLIISDG
ncbi:hypothetical protein Gotur_014670, partial [Gossypium turneri]